MMFYKVLCWKLSLGLKRCSQKRLLPSKQLLRQTMRMNRSHQHLGKLLRRQSSMCQRMMMMIPGTSSMKMVFRYFPTSSVARRFCSMASLRIVGLWFDTLLHTTGTSGWLHGRFLSIIVTSEVFDAILMPPTSSVGLNIHLTWIRDETIVLYVQQTCFHAHFNGCFSDLCVLEYLAISDAVSFTGQIPLLMDVQKVCKLCRTR